MSFNVDKNQGSVGNEGFNSSLGKPNPTPGAVDTRSRTLKSRTKSLSTRLPVMTARGKVGPHSGL